MTFKFRNTTWPSCIVCHRKAPQGLYFLDPRDHSKGRGPELTLWGSVTIPMLDKTKETFNLCPDCTDRVGMSLTNMHKRSMDRLDTLIVASAGNRAAIRETHGDALVDGVIVRKGITVCALCKGNRDTCGHYTGKL
jgi:hypothetical protein